MAFVSLTDLVYPVGSLYISNDSNLNTAAKVVQKFGGQWQKLDSGYSLCTADTPSRTAKNGDEHTHKYGVRFGFFKRMVISTDSNDLSKSLWGIRDENGVYMSESVSNETVTGVQVNSSISQTLSSTSYNVNRITLESNVEKINNTLPPRYEVNVYLRTA